jgi:hypothetical protein
MAAEAANDLGSETGSGLPEEIPAMWLRHNYRGRPVDLRGGPSLTSGLMLAASRAKAGPGSRAGAAAAIGAAGLAGLLDDLKGDGSAKGLKGHFRRLAHGQVTTGLIKLAVLAGAGVVFAVLNDAPAASGTKGRSGRGGQSGVVGRVAKIGVDAAVVAGAANLINLLDLRPGRALKAAGVPAAVLGLAPGAGGEMAAGIAGAVAAAAPSDLGERTMLGDCGANSLGAALGVALVRSLPMGGRVVAAIGIGGLILASEKVSFTKVIAGNPTLRRLDELGRVDVHGADDPAGPADTVDPASADGPGGGAGQTHIDASANNAPERTG